MVAALVVAGCVALGGRGEGAEPAAEKAKQAARRAVEPAVPVLPATLVARLQEGKFAEAEAELRTLEAGAKTADERAYLALILGTTQRLGGKTDSARETLTKALSDAPRGAWTAKLRYELASLELASGHVKEAEALTRADAEALLAGERKDRLAEVYHAFARRLLKPDDPITPADPRAALDLLAQARGLAKGESLRARLLFAIASAAQAANDHGRAILEFQRYVKEYPKGADRFEARYQLGASQNASNQRLAARLTWSDLARDLDAPANLAEKADGEVRAKALFAIAKTYQMPTPPDDTSLNLGVAALRRFLSAYPAHPSAVQAAFQIATAYAARGKSEEALSAYTAFLKEDAFKAESDDARRDLARLSMTATFEIARISRDQSRFDEAIATWKGYLTKFPNGPQSADAQRAIVDTQFAIANEHSERARHDEARAAWQLFVAQNPLDARVPQALFLVGASFETQKKYDAAITAWEPLLSKFPASEPAAHAQFAIAAIFETEKGDLESAVDRFKKIVVEPWKSQAAQRIAVMESRTLTVVTPKTFRSGETPRLAITTRNLETLTFSAYKLNAEAYFRKKHALGNVESLDIGLVAPNAEWTVPVPGHAKYKPVEKDYDLAKIEVPGVYVVKVTDEKHLQATTLVVGSDIDAIVKTSRDQVLVFAQDMKTGKGRPNARVLVAQGDAVILEAKTGADGVLLKSWDKPREVGSGLAYLILDGANVAGSDLAVPGVVSRGLSPRAYIYADRPAYRPGQKVALRGVVREVENGQYANAPQSVYKLEVTDSRGRRIVARPVTLSDFGTFHETLPLDSGAPVGTYRVRLYQPGKSEFAGEFEVQSYQLQKIDLKFDLKKTVYFRGETVKGDIVARYGYGAPVANRPIALRLPDGRVLHGTTDHAGKYPLEFSTDGFAEETTLRLAAQLPQDGVTAGANVALVIRAFDIVLQTTRDVYLDGESFQVRIHTDDPQGNPTGESLSAVLLEVVTQAGQTTEREVARKKAATDPKTGDATVSFKADDDEGGRYLVRVMGTDRFKNPVVTDRALSISGKKDEVKLRLLANRQTYKVGEEASVNLHSRGHAGTAILTWEADRILSYKLVTLAEGDNPVGWAVNGAQFPNFTLNAARMAGAKFDQAQLDFRVERDLRVTLTPTKPVVKPGEDVTLDVTTVDQLGRPVAAELSLALVDQSLLRRFADKLPPIGPYFYDQTRTGAFSTASTNTFTYHPATTPVAEAVVEEQELTAAMNRNAGEAGRVRGEAERQLALGAAPATPSAAGAAFGAQGIPMDAAAAADRPAMGSMMGGMGGMGGGRRDEARSRFANPRPGAASSDAAKADADDKSLDAIAGSEMEGAERKKALAEKGGAVEQLSDGSVTTLRSAVSAPQQSAAPRERFVETAYWNPSIVTDKDGKARVTFKAPTALSDYRFSARGVTGSDTLVGQTTAELVVRKDFFVDLKMPPALTQGDKPRFIGQIHHVGVKGTVEVKLSAYAGENEQVYPRTLEITTDGIDEIVFDPFEVPESDNVRLTLTATVGRATDELVAEVPVRPWGVQAFASASGTSTNDASVFVGLPPGRAYENPEMLVVVSPTLQRLLIELALGRDYFMPLVKDDRALRCVFPPPPNTTADRASDLLAAASALSYLRSTRGASAAPEASRLTDRIRGLVAELTAIQNDDGGWPWVAGGGPRNAGRARPSDRTTSARAVWALASAEPLGLLTDAGALDKAVGYLTEQFARANAGDHDTRAALLHALSTRGKANFETANSLNRLRQGLSDSALAYLALTFANLDRGPLAGEVLDILAPRGKTEIAAPGDKPRRFWGDSVKTPITRGPAEPTALVALAFAKARPQAAELDGAIEWLLAHRQGFGWTPHQAKGPALAALGLYYGKARSAEDRFELVVTVNDAEVYRSRLQGAAEGQAVLVPSKHLRAGDKNRVRFQVEGRGTFGYAVTLTGFTRDFGPDQDRANRSAVLDRRVYLPADPELDGKTLPSGFGVAVNATQFENFVSQVAYGGRARVEVRAFRNLRPNEPEWERDFLIVEEHLPAGASLIDGSVQTSANLYTLADGVLTFYFAPDQWPNTMRYEVFGEVPGRYRALPASIRSAYDPGRVHLGPTGDLRVLAPGESSTDPYKATPDELYARGKAHYDAGRLADAAAPLEELFNAYTLRDDVARDAARMLLLINIKQYNPRKVVQYFEVVKEKAPELVITFDDLLVIGRAYRDINEFERAAIVWRGVAEASYLEDARIGEALRQRGKSLESMAYLLDLWREYPNTASIESDFFGLSQVLARNATQAFSDPSLRRELAEAGVTRSELILQSIRLIQAFMAQSPRNPLADEASLALVNNFLELEDHKAVVKLAARFAGLYPKSSYLDGFQYSEALGEFYLGHYDRAVEVAETIATASYKDAAGADQPSPNKWQALYILGQIFDARRQPAKALAYYRQVAERFTDAAEAVTSFTRKGLRLSEVTVVRPPTGPKPAEGAARPGDEPEPKFPDTLKLNYRNIAEADVKVYPVDLMRLYLTRRNLDQIAGIDLAGITPVVEKTIKLGSGEDFAEKLRTIDLGLAKEGAYLVMIRGDDLYTSGIVLVSPLELEVLEEPTSGRVRVTVRDAATKEFVPKVQVKVIGSGNRDFLSGDTDLRGVFLAEGVQGEAAVVARKGAAQYAFYRGATPLAAPAPAPSTPANASGAQGAPLEQILRMQNGANQLQCIDRLQKRYQAPQGGGMGGAAAGGFR